MPKRQKPRKPASPAGFQVTRSKGSIYVYHRSSRTKVDLEAFPFGSDAFYAECARISAAVPPTPPRRRRNGTLGDAMRLWRARHNVKRLAPRTRSDYEKVLYHLRPLEDVDIRRFRTGYVEHLMQEAVDAGRGVKFANTIRTVLSLLVKVAARQEWVPADAHQAVLNAEPLKDLPERKLPNRVWAPDEVAAVLAAADPGVRVPLALMAFTGCDPQDAIALRWEHVRLVETTSGPVRAIDITRGKTGGETLMPVIPPLAAELEMLAHKAGVLARNSRGQPWTGAGLRASWRKLRIALEEAGAVRPGLTMKGLRHTYATRAKAAGAGLDAIADALGQATVAMAAHYSKTAARFENVRDVAARLAEDYERHACNHSAEVSKRL